MIPYGRQQITQADVDAVSEVLRSDWITQGPTVPRFESELQSYCGVSHAVAVNSATAALHLACVALGLGPGDRFWTSPVTFIASAACGLYCGAEVDFVDIDPETYNMSVEALASKLELAKREGVLPKVVIPVHLGGQSCDMQEIWALSEQYGFRVIEDASHALGGTYLGEPVGSCRYSDIAVFSFHPVKIVTTGEGGVALTNDAELAERMSSIRSHGITRDADKMQCAPDGPWYYEQLELGYNYRMTDIQAALGASQLQRLDDYISRRNEIARRYDAELLGLPLILPHVRETVYSAFHLYIVRIDPVLSPVSHLEAFELLRENGIGVNLHYIPLPVQPFYQRMGFRIDDFPCAQHYYATAISLPVFPGLSHSQQEVVVKTLQRVLSA